SCVMCVSLMTESEIATIEAGTSSRLSLRLRAVTTISSSLSLWLSSADDPFAFSAARELTAVKPATPIAIVIRPARSQIALAVRESLAAREPARNRAGSFAESDIYPPICRFSHVCRLLCPGGRCTQICKRLHYRLVPADAQYT